MTTLLHIKIWVGPKAVCREKFIVFNVLTLKQEKKKGRKKDKKEKNEMLYLRTKKNNNGQLHKEME